jgi:hypothetical protein
MTMSKGTSFVELEKQFDDAMATVTSLYELMWNTEIGSDFGHETIEKIGRGGLISAKRAEKAFHDLMDLYLNDQQELKRKKIETKKSTSETENPPNDPLVERAVNIIEKAKVKTVKQ